MYCPDNYDQWRSHDAERERELEKLPRCTYCGKPIQDDECIELDGEVFHIECFMNEHKKDTNDFIY